MNLQRAFRNLLLLLGTLLLGMVAVSLWGGRGQLYTSNKSFSPWLLALIVLMAPLNYLLRLIKWTFLLRRLKVEADFRASTLTFLAGLGLSLLPGKMGELANPYVLKQLSGVETHETFSAVVMLRFTDVVSVAMLALLSSRAFPWATVPIAVLIFMFSVGGATLCSPWAFGAFIRLSPPFIQRKLRELSKAQQGFRCLMKPDVLVVSLALGCVSWTFEGTIVYLALKGLGESISPLTSLFVVSFSTVSGGLSLLPGGIGVTEASIATLLSAQGISPPIAGLVTVITRISTVWLGAMIGAAALYRVALELKIKEGEH